MTKIEVFDPALCCSSGVCGTDVDQQLVDFSADVEWARQQGAQIERFNLAQQPMVFAQNAVIKAQLERWGASALPVTLVDGALGLAGSYPSRETLACWVGLAVAATEPEPPPAASACACTGGCA